jgi:thiol-disulfide isomerase/thioredoxin
MVLCIVALVIFGVLSIFSARYRQLTGEAFNCVVRKITLRPCDTKLDEKIRAKILAKVLRHSPQAASFLNKNFEVLSIVFTVIFFASLGYTIYSLYNLLVFGTCDPVTGNCVFVPPTNSVVTQIQLNGTNYTGKPPCGLEGFIEFYGAECPHCAKMKPILEKVEIETGVNFTKLEIWHNDTNRDIFLTHADSIQKDCGVLGVPTFYSVKTDRAICGEINEARLKRFILENG